MPEHAKHSDSTEPTQISWESERSSKPERPSIAKNLNPEALIERPRRVLVALALFAVAALGAVAIVVRGLLVIEDMRAKIVDALPTDITDDYTTDGVERAATVLLFIAAALIVVLLAAQALTLSTFIRRRSGAARVTFTILGVASIAAIGVWLVIRESTTRSLWIGAAACLFIVLAAALVCTPRVTRWLRQGEERRRIVLADAAAHPEAEAEPAPEAKSKSKSGSKREA